MIDKWIARLQAWKYRRQLSGIQTFISQTVESNIESETSANVKVMRDLVKRNQLGEELYQWINHIQWTVFSYEGVGNPCGNHLLSRVVPVYRTADVPLNVESLKRMVCSERYDDSLAVDEVHQFSGIEVFPMAVKASALQDPGFYVNLYEYARAGIEFTTERPASDEWKLEVGGFGYVVFVLGCTGTNWGMPDASTAGITRLVRQALVKGTTNNSQFVSGVNNLPLASLYAESGLLPELDEIGVGEDPAPYLSRLKSTVGELVEVEYV